MHLLNSRKAHAAVTNHYRFLVLLLAAAPAFGQRSFSLCDINKDGAIDVVDIQALIAEALGGKVPLDDLNNDNVVNVVDVEINARTVLGSGCPAYSVTPRFAITQVSLVNQGWIPADIPSPGDLTLHGASTSQATVLNQGWIPADIPSPGDLTLHGASTSQATVLNQAWIPADIPSPGDLTLHGASTSQATVLNQAWIPADIPSAGNIQVAVGLLVSVNNNGSTRSPASFEGLDSKIVAAGSSTAPVDLSTVNDGDAMIAGQTVRFRVYPPEGAFTASDFMVGGAPLRVHAPFEALLTAPANVTSLDLEAVVYASGGRVWHTPAKHLRIVRDPGLTMSGRALLADGGPAGSAAIGVRTNGLMAAYFQVEGSLPSWSALNRPPDKEGFVTAVNQPGTAVFGPDPFGTGLTGPYAARFRGEILVSISGEHRLFLDAALGARLAVDGKVLIDTPAGQFSPESEADVNLAPGWHTIEIDSYHTASSPGVQLSWQQPHSGREAVRPEALAADCVRAETDANGAFRIAPFPSILNPLEWHAVPANNRIRVVPDLSISQERPIQQ